jgi:hypothetical protein
MYVDVINVRMVTLLVAVVVVMVVSALCVIEGTAVQSLVPMRLDVLLVLPVYTNQTLATT